MRALVLVGEGREVNWGGGEQAQMGQKRLLGNLLTLPEGASV